MSNSESGKLQNQRGWLVAGDFRARIAKLISLDEGLSRKFLSSTSLALPPLSATPTNDDCCYYTLKEGPGLGRHLWRQRGRREASTNSRTRSDTDSLGDKEKQIAVIPEKSLADRISSGDTTTNDKEPEKPVKPSTMTPAHSFSVEDKEKEAKEQETNLIQIKPAVLDLWKEAWPHGVCQRRES